MEAAAVAPARTRVAMVSPPVLQIVRGVVDVRAEARDDAELVDQLHLGEYANVLTRRAGWAYVQAWDHYFGWIPETSAAAVPTRRALDQHVVGVPLAEIHERADAASAIVGHAPAGTWLPENKQLDKPDWLWVSGGWIERAHTVRAADIPRRPPTADDLIDTAEAFLGVPYLWGGTTALGLDCSGYVQQVYRLNGILLDRDADQQATEGRPVDEARPGDLLFFTLAGADPGVQRITHVALSLGGEDYLNAPERGRFVQGGTFSSRKPRFARRYLPDPE